MKKILVAEDDSFLASAYKMKLSKAGYDVKSVSNGKEALEAIKEFSPDLIILDLVMPEMDGFAFLESKNKNDEIKDLPVIVASNLSQSDDVVKAIQMGAVDYIVKTDLSMKEILEKVEKVLGE